MIKNFLMATAFVLTSAGAAAANDVQYTFADGDGVPYCDGISLTESDGMAVGIHTNGAQCSEGDFAGGLQVKVLGSHGKKYTITTTDPNLRHTVEMYVLDQSNMTWSVYDMDTADDSPFSLANQGILLDGTPPAGGHNAVSGHKP